MDNLENSVLGFLIHKPQLIKTDGLLSSDFSGKARTILFGIAGNEKTP
jgi:hypothetical protein